jgi:hypothetical protein
MRLPFYAAFFLKFSFSQISIIFWKFDACNDLLREKKCALIGTWDISCIFFTKHDIRNTKVENYLKKTYLVFFLGSLPLSKMYERSAVLKITCTPVDKDN